jgi:hypothetical protein
MTNIKEVNTCKSVLTLERYLDSCPIALALFPDMLPKFFSGDGSQRGLHYSLAYFKNSFENNGFIDYIKHPQRIHEDSSRLPSLESRDAMKTDLPKVFQGLWLTNKDNPHVINGQLSNFIEQSKKLEGYETVIWTNINPNKLKEMNPSLEAENISVKDIAAIETEHAKLLDLVLTPRKYLKFIGGWNGVVIDITKYIIAESQGGILADLNFEFDKDFKQSSLESYDFIAAATDFNRIENGFFIVKPHHVVFRELLNIIDEMTNNPDCSLYELRKMVYPTEIFSMMPLGMAYMKYNNQEDNADVLVNSKVKNKSNLPDMDKINEHEAKVDMLESSNINDFNVYIESYLTCLDSGGFVNSNFIEEPIGRDNYLTQTWNYADIIA